jgi:hypothetical protein
MSPCNGEHGFVHPCRNLRTASSRGLPDWANTRPCRPRKRSRRSRRQSSHPHRTRGSVLGSRRRTFRIGESPSRAGRSEGRPTRARCSWIRSYCRCCLARWRRGRSPHMRRRRLQHRRPTGLPLRASWKSLHRVRLRRRGSERHLPTRSPCHRPEWQRRNPRRRPARNGRSHWGRKRTRRTAQSPRSAAAPAGLEVLDTSVSCIHGGVSWPLCTSLTHSRRRMWPDLQATRTEYPTCRNMRWNTSG